MTLPSLTFCRSVLLVVSIVLSAHLLYAQYTPSSGPSDRAAVPVMPGAGPHAPPMMGPGGPRPPQMPPGEPGKPGGPPGKPGDAAKPPETPKPLQRPAKPETPPNPAELKVGPDKKGEFKINFNGQPWLPVLEWLAEHSKMSLEWSELPGDYLNLTTQRSYKIREVRDLINRRLLVRGYTMLCQDETLAVVNIKTLDASLVPRIDPKQLDQRNPYEFVRVSFTLDSLMADTAVRELKPMLSANGKLTAMADVNRIEAMDTVINLLEIRAVLKQEQSVENQRRMVREFKIVHARADDVRDILQSLVTGETKAPAKGQTPEQAQQAAMMARMQQQGGQPPGQPGQPPGAPAAAKMGVAFVVNSHENSIWVTAPPDKMATIVQVIEKLDVPTDRSQSPAGAMDRTQIYRLVGVDPEAVVKTLEEVGNLSPTTHLEVDKKNKLIIADASPVDHATIRSLVEKLSGSDRSFEVLSLRRLRADSVAASIEFMMGIDSKKKKKEPRHYWNPWDDYSSSNANEKANEFRVDADVENNRLLLWANKIELGEVQKLLAKLGEDPPKGSDNKARRVIDVGNLEETKELLERIRAEWSSVAPNPLVLPPLAPDKKKAEAVQEPTPDADSPSLPSKSTAAPPRGTVLRLAELRRESTADEAGGNRDKTPSKTPAPVEVRVGPDGKLVISSRDARALDLFEDMITQMTPARKGYKVIRLRYASAYSVSLNLEDFFKDEPKKQQSWRPWWYDDYSSQDSSDNDDRGLSKRPRLKFISDPDTNSILVTGANASQLRTIDDLVHVYDRKPEADSELDRTPEIIYLRHTKAKTVADTVKDVYRDLLSKNDKALAGANQSQRGERRPFSFDFGSDSGKTEQKVPKFDGLLSIGIDEVSNSLVISAPKYILRPVGKMIRDLDEAAAANNAVRVVRVGHGVTADRLREIVDALQGQGAPGGSRAATPPRQPNPKRGQKPATNGGTQPAGHPSSGE